jgi:hypothetical protein
MPVAVLLLAAACSDDDSPTADEALASSPTVQVTPSSETIAPTPADDTDSQVDSGFTALPTRDGPRRETTLGVPHIQLDAVAVPEVDAELRRRVFSLPGVEDRPSELGFGGARSLWLSDDIELARPEILLSGREFAHIHPNGSLHIWLPVDQAFEVALTKWGELHPWVGREDFWDGMSMIYTPETLDEVDVTMLLVVDAYNYVTGANLDPADFG